MGGLTTNATLLLCGPVSKHGVVRWASHNVRDHPHQPSCNILQAHSKKSKPRTRWTTWRRGSLSFWRHSQAFIISSLKLWRFLAAFWEILELNLQLFQCLWRACQEYHDISKQLPSCCKGWGKSSFRDRKKNWQDARNWKLLKTENLFQRTKRKDRPFCRLWPLC